MIKAEYKTKDQNYQNEQTTYWFEITSSDSPIVEVGETYGYCQEPDSFLIVDCDGCPVTPEEFIQLEQVLEPTEEMIYE